MRAAFATEHTPGRVNEDAVAVGDGWAFILDGATARAGVVSGCVHDVRWLASTLAGELAQRLLSSQQTLPALPDLLAESIQATRRQHGPDCDLSNPDSPSSTAVIARWTSDEFEYLVLADSPLILDLGGTIRPIIDDRIAHLPDYSADGVARSRNQPGGFWVASTNPDAAYQAVTGSAPAEEVHRAALLSDGASRLVEQFGVLDWLGLMDLLDKSGPAELIRRTRAAERAEAPEMSARRQEKRHDDATAILLRG
ncbi:protein phosphatase 2C domain-containing protein [Frankia sp. Mgl5]|uniref:protein phosphatase 2C domain-containing protein n=1 Tax=Frankia sp. Mgl5 TaxID=2933793 RepID=UPI00200F2B1B|nr:protein phosphatase 2C domain-containing protein [Frankia sp. Mgl5]MCK9930755.1 protein phosphatase 2C domain-containing protein [Frankia sp. Mgl5]